MTTPAIGRQDVLDMLAGYRLRGAESSAIESIDSLELAWLLHQVEQRYGLRLDLDDDQLDQMSTVDGAVLVLGKAVG